MTTAQGADFQLWYKRRVSPATIYGWRKGSLRVIGTVTFVLKE
jgi:hypothetical protein